MEEIDDKVKKLFKGHQVVGLDTMPFIYSMEARKPYIHFLRSIFGTRSQVQCLPAACLSSEMVGRVPGS